MIYDLQTESLKDQKITIKTNIGTLKEVWNILKEVNLDSLLTGGTLDMSFTEIIDGLLVKGTLNGFINTITSGLEKPVDELDLTDVVGIVSLFFTSIAQPFQGLNIALSNQKVATAQT